MNEQEKFWQGEFGDKYSERNKENIRSNIHLFATILSKITSPGRILEFGCGTGNNMAAIHTLDPDINLMGVEINKQAIDHVSHGETFRESVLDFNYPEGFPKPDITMTKGFLIHVHPADLATVYRKLYESTNRYILICEYYNPFPVEVPYRGHTGKLWKRDFANDLLMAYPDLRLVDYGFVYHLDEYPQDDLTWFILEKSNG